MNRYAEALFDQFRRYAEVSLKEMADHIHEQTPLTPNQRKNIERVLDEDIGNLIHLLLGAFDNIGSALPEGVWGFDIIHTDPETDEASDIRDAELDYYQMWLDYLDVRRSHNPRQ